MSSSGGQVLFWTEVFQLHPSSIVKVAQFNGRRDRILQHFFEVKAWHLKKSPVRPLNVADYSELFRRLRNIDWYGFIFLVRSEKTLFRKVRLLIVKILTGSPTV